MLFQTCLSSGSIPSRLSTTTYATAPSVRAAAAGISSRPATPTNEVTTPIATAAAADGSLAGAIASAVRDLDPSLVLYGLAGSEMVRLENG